MAKPHLTSEERLLAIIKKNKVVQKDRSASQTNKSSGSQIGVYQFLRNFNAVLLVGALVLFGYGVYWQLFSHSFDFVEEYDYVNSSENSPTVKSDGLDGRNIDISFVKNRNIFTFSKATEEPSTHLVSPKEFIPSNILKSVSFQGVLIEGNDRLAILKNNIKNASYFLREGDSIDEAMLLEISENMVIFEIEGRKVEIFKD